MNRLLGVTAVSIALFACSALLAQQEDFIRGDADGNGSLNALVDAIFILVFQYQGGTPPPCLEAADVDGNGDFHGLLDALKLLNNVFDGGCLPPPPWPECGPDPDPANSLGCGPNGCP